MVLDHRHKPRPSEVVVVSEEDPAMATNQASAAAQVEDLLSLLLTRSGVGVALASKNKDKTKL